MLTTAPLRSGAAPCYFRHMRRLLPAVLVTTLLLALAPSGAHAATRTINFDDFTAPTLFADSDGPVTDRYASLGVHFAGPATNDGGTVLDVSTFTVTGQSAPNALAFNTGAMYSADAGGGVPRGPETITFDTPIYSASIRVGQTAGGTVRLTALDGATPVSTNFQTSQSDLQALDVAAARITSLRLEFSGTATVWDDLTWSTSPVSANDAFGTPANTALNVGAPGVLGNDRDPDGDPITAALQRAPANGTVDLRANGSFTYTPRAGFFGIDSFDYRASDGPGNGNVATVSIAVAAPPPPPPTLLSSTVSIGFDAFPKFTKVTALRVNDLPKNWKVAVSLQDQEEEAAEEGLPLQEEDLQVGEGEVEAQAVQAVQEEEAAGRARTITVTITATGFIGKQFTYTMRKGKAPKRPKRLCMPPGGKPGKMQVSGLGRERPLEQRREHDLRLRPGDRRAGRAGARASPRGARCRGRGRGRPRSPRPPPCRRRRPRGGARRRRAPRRPPCGPRSRAPRSRACPSRSGRVDLGGVAADDAVGLEPVDAPLDRRGAQRRPAARCSGTSAAHPAGAAQRSAGRCRPYGRQDSRSAQQIAIESGAREADHCSHEHATRRRTARHPRLHAAARHRPRRAVGRQRHAGRLLLHARLRLPRGRLRRARDRRARPHLARARAGPHPARPHRRADARTTRSRRTTPRHGDGVEGDRAVACPTSTHAYREAVERGATGVRRAAGSRPTSTARVRIADDRRLRRHAAHASSSAATTPAPFLPGYDAARGRDAGDAGLLAHRPHRRQRRARPHGRRGSSSTRTSSG